MPPCHIVYPAEGREHMHRSAGNSSFCHEHVEVLTSTSIYCQFTICVFHLSKFHTNQSFVFSNIISCNLIYNANKIFKLWDFIIHALLPGTSKAFKLSVFCSTDMFTSFCRAHNNIVCVIHDRKYCIINFIFMPILLFTCKKFLYPQ